jgi:excisionase family DNA binding protein
MDSPTVSQPSDARATEPTTASSRWLSARDAARYSNVGVGLIYKAVAARRLRHVRLGSKFLRFREGWLDQWLEAEAVEVAPLMEKRR